MNARSACETQSRFISSGSFLRRIRYHLCDGNICLHTSYTRDESHGGSSGSSDAVRPLLDAAARAGRCAAPAPAALIGGRPAAGARARRARTGVPPLAARAVPVRAMFVNVSGCAVPLGLATSAALRSACGIGSCALPPPASPPDIVPLLQV